MVSSSSILTLELLVFARQIGGYTVALTGADLGLVDQLAQGFNRHTQALGDRGNTAVRWSYSSAW